MPEEQWCNTSDGDQEELEGSETQEEQEEELRAEREMQEDLTCMAEGCGAAREWRRQGGGV